jgi:hypothetical protein
MPPTSPQQPVAASTSSFVSTFMTSDIKKITIENSAHVFELLEAGFGVNSHKNNKGLLLSI